MRIIRVGDAGRFLRRRAAAGRGAAPPRVRRTAESIVEDVRRNGDAAVRRYERRFGPDPPPPRAPLRASRREIDRAYSAVSPRQISAIRLARSRLARSESALRRQLRGTVVRGAGRIRVSRSFVPIDSVGCYVPGGGARYPSSAVMAVTPAKVAGVGRIAVASPPGSGGGVDPLTAVAADICGATEIYKVGGAQAIAALAYGTRSVGRVDKVVGPGGALVTAAKHAVSGAVAIDMAAGPTELGIVIDSEDDADLAALDLISQAEHSADTTCYALATTAAIARRIRSRVDARLGTVRRAAIARASLESNGFIAVCRPADIVRLADGLAPEHLEIISRRPGRWSGIRGPGLILEGRGSPSSASDYALGSNHILPTGGSGRARGSLSVLDFLKILTRVRVGAGGLEGVAGAVREMALAEGLPNHYEAVRGRLG